MSIERNARLLCRARMPWLDDTGIDQLGEMVRRENEGIAADLAAAGLTIAPIEPSEATVDAMAKAMHDDYPHPRRQDEWDELDAAGKSYWLHKARAAWRAGIGREQG